MAIPFRDLHNEDALGSVGYLRFVREEQGRGIRGALFLANARGEPLEFVYSRIDLHAPFLWRDGDAKRHAVTRLAGNLFQSCPSVPSLLLALAAETHPKMFVEDMHVEIPLCRVSAVVNPATEPTEPVEVLADAVHLFWAGTPPPGESSTRRMLDLLVARKLILEPFERAAIGIAEAYRDD